jgi:hypothetical protein
MECREVRQLAEAFVSEQLLVETTEAVVAHLDRCPLCRAEVEALRRLRAATRSAFERHPDLAARPELRSELTAMLATRVKADPVRLRPTPKPRLTWLAIAASLLLIMGAGWGWRAWSTSHLSALLHAAVGDHRFCALTFKLTERPIPLAEAARRYGSVVDGLLQTVEPSTIALNGGPLRIIERHSCVFEGRRFSHIVLRYKGAPVSLLVTADTRPGRVLWGALAGAPQTPSVMPVTDGFHVASFSGARHVVFVVSSLNDADVHDVAGAMAVPVSRALAAGEQERADVRISRATTSTRVFMGSHTSWAINHLDTSLVASFSD